MGLLGLMCVDHFAVVGRQGEDDGQTAARLQFEHLGSACVHQLVSMLEASQAFLWQHSFLWVHSDTDTMHSSLWYNARRHAEPSECARNQQWLTVGMSAASGFCRCLQMEETQVKACCISSGCRAPPARA